MSAGVAASTRGILGKSGSARTVAVIRVQAAISTIRERPVSPALRGFMLAKCFYFVGRLLVASGSNLTLMIPIYPIFKGLHRKLTEEWLNFD
jgi:hypothetical protein